MAKADISASVNVISAVARRGSRMWAKPVYTKRKSASAERCFRPLGAAFAIGSPVSSLVHRACRWAIVALAGTPRQLGWHVGYWALWLTGNCWPLSHLTEGYCWRTYSKF